MIGVFFLGATLVCFLPGGKQWKTRAKRVWGLRKLGIEKRQAILMAEMGNRYMVVAHNPTLKQAITKEKLTKRGLISLSDYYAEVHI